MSVGLALLSAHLLADFPLQTDRMAAQKFDEPGTRAIHSTVHVVLYLAFLLPVAGLQQAALASGVLGLLHFAIDTRRWAKPKDGFEIYPIAVDQSLHITTLFAVSLLL